jgi:hypothetical protein
MQYGRRKRCMKISIFWTSLATIQPDGSFS